MLYPLMATLSNQSNFCMSVSLSEKVDPVLLRDSLEISYRRFPYYKVKVERGLFRPYLAENPAPVRVWPSDGVLLGRTDYVKNGYLPIMVSYWERTVFVTFFHGLGDGTAASIFTGYLICTYLSRLYPHLQLDVDALYPVYDNETENAYDTFYTSQSFTEGLRQTAGGGYAAQVKGTFFVQDGLGCVQGRIAVDKLLDVTHRLGCSVTELLAAVSMTAAMRTRAKVTETKRPRVFIPVNLRNLFASHTMFNFVGNVMCTLPYTTELAPCIEAMHEQLPAQCTRDAFAAKLSFASTLSKNPVARNLPLAIKVGIIKLSRGLTTSTKQTMIVSNLGRVALPKEVLPYIRRYTFTLNCNRRTPVNVAAVSCGEDFVVSISRHIVQNDIAKEFFAIMRELQLDFAVSSNYREVSNAL